MGRSQVQFPIASERGLLDFLFSQQQAKRPGNCVGAFSKLRCQVSHADDHIPGWVALMNLLRISGNLVGQRTLFFSSLALGRFCPCLVGVKDPHTDRGDSNDGNYRCDPRN